MNVANFCPNGLLRLDLGTRCTRHPSARAPKCKRKAFTWVVSRSPCFRTPCDLRREPTG